MTDIYNSGTPKYQSPQDIYDAIQTMQSGEEIGIISEMFSDVSWENQDYYYTENGDKLIARWNDMTDCCDKMWLMDIAAWQMTDEDANDWIYQILCNEDLSKRIGFKKMFVDIVLAGMNTSFATVEQTFYDELAEMNYFDFSSNSAALKTAMESVGISVYKNPYGELCSAVYKKLKGLRLDDEKQLITESRAMLAAYDDFMFGLKSNQYLYNQQETMYQQKVA
ncbi:MAG: hypothetical protein RSD64_04680, partial [Christensenellaceae bacterium]